MGCPFERLRFPVEFPLEHGGFRQFDRRSDLRRGAVFYAAKALQKHVPQLKPGQCLVLSVDPVKLPVEIRDVHGFNWGHPGNFAFDKRFFRLQLEFGELGNAFRFAKPALDEGAHGAFCFLSNAAFGAGVLKDPGKGAQIFFLEGLFQLALQAVDPVCEEPGPAPFGLDLRKLGEPAHFPADLGGERGEDGVVFGQALDLPCADFGLAGGLGQRCGQGAIGGGPFGGEPEPDAVLRLFGDGGLHGGGFFGGEALQSGGVGVFGCLDLFGVGAGVLGGGLGLGADLGDQGGEFALGVLVDGDARGGVALEGVHLRGKPLGVVGGAEGEGGV